MCMCDQGRKRTRAVLSKMGWTSAKLRAARTEGRLKEIRGRQTARQGGQGCPSRVRMNPTVNT